MALSEQQIGVIIDYASERVRELVNNYDTHAFEDDKDLQRLFIAISNLYDELNVTMADVLPRAIYQSYIKGVTKAEKLLEAADMGGVSLGSKGVANLVKAPLHVEAINNVLSDTLADLSAAIRTAKTYGINELDKAHNEVRRELADGLIAGFTTDQITKRVAEKFSERGMTSFITVDNKHLPLDFYAKTVTRTKLQTAENHGHLNRYNERNVKHVLVTGNIPTCGECAAYRGIVFATERGDKFPYINLYKTFPVHPNCRCNFRPWIKKFKSDEEIDQALETAKHFDPEKETRSKAEAKKYDANQKAKAAARQKRLTFNKMQAKLGKDGPQSFKEFKNASKRQYHDWVAQTKGLTNKNVQADVNDVILNSEISNESETTKMNNTEKQLLDYSKNVWEPMLEFDETQAVKNYSKTDYKVINAILNSGTTLEEIAPEIRNEIQSLSNAINKFNLQTDITVFRGIGKKEFDQIISGANLVKNFLSFKSTSLSNTVADNFATFSNMDDGISNQKHIIIANIKKGANGAYIAPISNAKKEKEFVLNRQTEYKIVDNIIYNGVKYIVIEVV
ncbi:phage minor capsid protein [Staphylococcus xylosus]